MNSVCVWVAAVALARRALYDTLRGVPLHALVLNTSTFVHVGTVGEYLHHLCHDDALAAALHLTRRALVAARPPPANDLTDAGVDTLSLTNAAGPADLAHVARTATLMAVVLPSAPHAAQIDHGTVVEACHVGAGAHIGHGCILR
jgi:hypothetical protein